jgi:hypothetical protein
MALVKCPKHKIPYNDANPRGCPACALEKEGGGMMQELARASQMVKRPSSASLPPVDVDGPVSRQPRIPLPSVRRFAQLFLLLRNRRNATVAAAIIVSLLLILVISKRTRFTDAPNPVVYNGVVRPFPVSPNDPITMVFSALGPQKPTPNPDAQSLERYSYGTDLFVDAINGRVYAVTIAVPNRSWQGLRVGMSATNAEGALAMMGAPREAESRLNGRADTLAGYVVYRSLESRPRRTLVAEVRPPNNCFDVMVELQPRSIGYLTRGGQKWVALNRPGGPLEWVITRIQVVSRSATGPYSAGPAC